ncbi:MAG: DUF692 family protein [Alphaproteobacteria bacterium]|nr:DUF692 family protein [Alphaproteobacteria bacterium]
MSAPDGLDALPVLGVGASLSFGAEPDPVALAAAPGGPAFIEYAGAAQHTWLAEPLGRLRAAGVPVLYHPSCLNLCGPDPNPPAWLAAVDAHVRAAGSAWLAQDVAVCFIGPTPGYSIQLGYFIPPVLTQPALDEAAARVAEVRAAVDVPLLLEPAPVTFHLGDMDIFTWLGQLAERTGCGLLLDAGHVVSHQFAAGRGLTEGLETLPLERVIELHVAGGVLQEHEGRRYYLDAHDLPPLPEAWQVLRWLLERCPNLRAVCVECEGAAAQAVLPMLQKTRERVAFGALSEALRDKARAELAT